MELERIVGIYLTTIIEGREGPWRGMRIVGPGSVEVPASGGQDGEVRPLWVVSGQNPMDQRLDEAANRQRHEAMGKRLVEAFGRERVFEVECFAPDRSWVERSWAVGIEAGAVTEVEALIGLARELEQRAVFRVGRDAVEVVMSSGGRDGEVVGRRDRWHRDG